jgi:hypothetical protein
MAKRGRKSKSEYSDAAPAAPKLLRKLADGTIEPRTRGRVPDGAINGYEDASGAFVEGNPPKSHGPGKRRGRPKGSKNIRTGAKRGRPPGRPGRPKGSSNARTGGLGEIEAIVRREVDKRVADARDAAIAAIRAALV